MANNATFPGTALAVCELLKAQLIGCYRNFLLLKGKPYLCALTHEALELIYSGVQELQANTIISIIAINKEIVFEHKEIAFEHKWAIFCEPCSL